MIRKEGTVTDLAPGDTILDRGTYNSACRMGDRNDHGHLGMLKYCFP